MNYVKSIVANVIRNATGRDPVFASSADIDENSIDEQVEYAKFLADIVSFWGEIPQEIVIHIGITDLFRLYKEIGMFFLDPSIDEDFKSFKYKGDKYYLPEKGMRKATLKEFIEASQFEQNCIKLEQGQANALPPIIAILARKKKRWWKSEIEPYSENIHTLVSY